ncbi:hypothetical protein [Olleya sp. YS]|uniref:hypothetical protein n=1 Tax=Olleya sp. YS TaxID=3028318 RepID=UPI002434165C|nr:hypothetical protein [Olleya sp. YS]WGD35819.1 hypothetical protein Ollyesu_05245 [Olleya sp. YS]
MSTKIKQNLFRFVTLRNPQLIDEKQNHKGFVFHPDENSSLFFQAIDGVKEDEKNQVLESVSREFNGFKTRKEVKEINQKLYVFSSWLMRNKNHLTFQSIKENANGVLPLNKEKKEDLLIWDNLINQTITKQSVYVREALIQVLIANQFLNAFIKFSEGLEGDIVFTEDQDQDFVRRANASVVLSKALFTSATVTEAPKTVSSAALKSLENTNDVAIAKYQNGNYKVLIEALKPIEVKYNKEQQKAYKTALNEHNKVVEQLIAEAEPVITEETDPKTGETVRVTTYPDLKLPKFEFSKVEAITTSYLEGKLSDTSLLLFNTEQLDVYDSFEEVNQALKAKIKANNQIIFSKSSKQSKQVKIGGVVTQINSKVPLLDYNIPPLMELHPSGSVSTFMVFYNVVEPAQIASINYTINFPDGTTDTDTGFSIVPTSNNMVRLFPNGTTYPSGVENYTITGEITLQSGEKYSFTQVVNLKSRFNMGNFQLVGSGTQTSDDNRIYGVTNLGIADFRRVEQEVCCYVPGEVSHIENVMAREYKERATRSLTSSEITTERTDEKERENLTDTTTTDRNEMQSEVASVLNEDQAQAYGASASVHGGTGDWGFNAGGYADFSSSNSTSNSNSQALTHAQEITERAMERIVSKTQTKRTSRILKEFEENNKHGFDNTKGAEHVTGVYRWVDKIYKNKLINYGKRLMYEFAIPEPARFLKDAIWKNIENDQEVDSVIVLPEQPIHPSDLGVGISSSSDLTEDNYQFYASEYNAEVDAPPLTTQTIGWEHAFSVQDKSSMARSNSTSLDIPKGYYTTKWGFAQTGKQYSSANWGISVGNDHHVGVAHFEKQIERDIDSFTEKLPISIYTDRYWGGTVTVTVNLERSDELLQQWKNETYNAIINAYNDRLREYNDAMVANEVQPTDDKYKLTFNPLHNRSLEKKEIKRIATELLIEQSKVSKNNYNSDEVAKVSKNEMFENHAATVKFFEQAFDWEIMAYTFYPYFYADESDWKDLFQQQDAADPLFQAFLQSGMARTVVPVRPGFEDAVNWYMTTGEIWNGQGLVVDQDDDLYVSIAEEMQTIEGEVEGTWETRLPTNLTVLQAGSIGLNVEGLPCNTDCNDFRLFDSDGEEILDENNQSFTNPIEQTNALLGVTEPETTTETR